MQTGMCRRDFITASVGAAVGLAGGSALAARSPFIWAGLYHLGVNMWSEAKATKKRLRFDRACWNEITARMQKVGMNMMVIDLGEGVVYPSHPELAVEGSWTPDELRAEIRRLRSMGIEAIPKLNFSATHDLWLGEYARMLSTRTYYKVCADIIRDVREIFDTPRFLHLGYDEEDYETQAKYDYAAVRQGELWWHDFLWFVRGTEKLGMRPWAWADYNRRHEKEFYARMPRSVVLSNNYYDDKFGPFPPDYKGYQKQRLQYFVDFDKHGFDQIPCGSTWKHEVGNMRELTKWCRERVSSEHLIGMLTTPWQETLPQYRVRNLNAIDDVGRAMAEFPGS